MAPGRNSGRQTTQIAAALEGGRSSTAAEIIAAFDSATVDVSDSARGWRYGAGRDLSRLEADAAS